MRAISGSSDKTIRLWDIQTGRELKRFEGHTERVTCVAYSPQGDRIVSSSGDGTVRLWDVDGGVELRTFKNNNQSVNSVAFSFDGRLILSGGFDGTVRISEISTGNELRRWSARRGFSLVRAVCFLSRRATRAGSELRSDDQVVGYGNRCRDKLLRWENAVDHFGSVLSDGQFALSGGGDKTVRLWKLPR